MPMRLKSLVLALAALAAVPVTATADTVVLVQGYLGSAGSWRNTGIAAHLHAAGWRDGGHMTLTPAGVAEVLPGVHAPKRFVTVDLLTEAPAMVQADSIGAYVAYLRRNAPREKVVLVAHSAGGVAARLFMVRHPDAHVAGLVTIATPHLGSSWAELGNFIGSTPVAWMTPFVGLGTINRSQGLYHDISREGPANLLGWLNRQPHPRAAYVSIVRVADPGQPVRGDSLVSGPSQDMNAVVALSGRAETIFSPGDHGLRPHDGVLLASILERIAAR
jgi:pimeloyl-ACP methyl ester carboxylesterase